MRSYNNFGAILAKKIFILLGFRRDMAIYCTGTAQEAFMEELHRTVGPGRSVSFKTQQYQSTNTVSLLARKNN